jgi:hypothetical protein
MLSLAVVEFAEFYIMKNNYPLCNLKNPQTRYEAGGWAEIMPNH